MLPETNELTELLSLYQPHIGGRLNLVVSAGAEVAGDSGTSDDLSNSLDRALLRELRKQADAVVTSGASVRAERLRASSHVPIFVLTKAGSIAGFETILDDANRRPVTLITLSIFGAAIRGQLDEAGFKNKVVEVEDLSPVLVWRALQKTGNEKLLFEFGPSLANLWTNSRLISEVCLTTTGVSENFRTSLPAFIEGFKATPSSSFYSTETSSRFDRFQLVSSV